jgi:predicted O-methyltransferase YrrM
MREGQYLSGLQNMIDSLPHHLTMVEIGSYAGTSAEMFLRSGKVDHLSCVDAWTTGYDDNDVASSSDMDAAEKEFDAKVSPYRNITKLKMWSQDAAAKFEDGSLDLVYIDGEHTYEGVKRDIELFLPKIKPGGIISGHDYYRYDWACVVDAVDEMLGKPEEIFVDTSWIRLG